MATWASDSGLLSTLDTEFLHLRKPINWILYEEVKGGVGKDQLAKMRKTTLFANTC